MRRSSKEKAESKENALLAESEAWERGERGRKSVAASKEEEVSLEFGLHMISLRLPSSIVAMLKRKAASKGMKYQPYIRQVLVEHVKEGSIEERVTRLERKIIGR